MKFISRIRLAYSVSLLRVFILFYKNEEFYKDFDQQFFVVISQLLYSQILPRLCAEGMRQFCQLPLVK